MPVFLIFAIVFTVWLRYEIKKASKKEVENKNFLEREQAANFTRKKDIENLDYIIIPLSKLPTTPNFKDDNITVLEIKDCINTVKKLSTKRILNLTGLSNTELKLKYGVANLDFLMQYDENFAKLSRALAKWGNLLFELGEIQDAKTVLEYAVSIGCDIETVFITLAKIYINLSERDKIKTLIEACSCFDDLRYDNMVSTLTRIYN